MTKTFNQEEFNKHLTAVEQLSNQKLIPLNISEQAVSRLNNCVISCTHSLIP